MNARPKGRRYKRVALDLEYDTIVAVSELAARLGIYEAELKRSAIVHSLTCALFLAEFSAGESVAPNEGTT